MLMSKQAGIRHQLRRLNRAEPSGKREEERHRGRVGVDCDPPVGPTPQDRTVSGSVSTLIISWEVSYLSIPDDSSFLSWSPGNNLFTGHVHILGPDYVKSAA